ncbi:MAG: YadA-like family protein, partial [Eikenella sp.]|nr:YadA-like family protein [Eikenella sp.]
GGGAGINPDGSFKAPSYTINKTDGTPYAPVDNVGDALSNLNAEVVRPLTFAGDTGTNVERKLGSTVNVKGGVTDPAKLTDNNIGVVANGTDTLTIKLAENIDLGASGSVKMGDTTVNSNGLTINGGPSVTKTGINAGNKVISGVANGVAPTDAVNVSQLEAAAAAAKTTLTSNDKSVTLVHDSTNNSYDLAVNTDNTTIVKDSTTGALKANTTAINTTPDGQAQVAPANADKLATAGDIANAINNSGFNLTANGANGSLVKPGSTVDLKNTDGNIAISKAGTDNNVGFDLAPVLNVGPSTGGNPVTINGNAGTIGGLTNKTFDPTNFTSGQAATEDQLAQVAATAGKRNTVSAGSNIVVTPTTANGVTNFEVATNPNMTLTSVTTTDAAGNQTVTNGNGVTITPAAAGKAPVSLTGDGLNNGGNKITNVAEGTAGTDAVNVDQLNKAINNVNVTIPGQLNSRLNGIEGRLDKVENTANAGVAQAIATAGLPQAYLPGKSMVAVGGGYYRGETGYAVGFSTISDGGNWIIKGTASGNSRGHFGASVGAGYQW